MIQRQLLEHKNHFSLQLKTSIKLPSRINKIASLRPLEALLKVVITRLASLKAGSKMIARPHTKGSQTILKY